MVFGGVTFLLPLERHAADVQAALKSAHQRQETRKAHQTGFWSRYAQLRPTVKASLREGSDQRKAFVELLPEIRQRLDAPPPPPSQEFQRDVVDLSSALALEAKQRAHEKNPQGVLEILLVSWRLTDFAGQDDELLANHLRTRAFTATVQSLYPQDPLNAAQWRELKRAVDAAAVPPDAGRVFLEDRIAESEQEFDRPERLGKGWKDANKVPGLLARERRHMHNLLGDLLQNPQAQTPLYSTFGWLSGQVGMQASIHGSNMRRALEMLELERAQLRGLSAVCELSALKAETGHLPDQFTAEGVSWDAAHHRLLAPLPDHMKEKTYQSLRMASSLAIWISITPQGFEFEL